MAFHMALFDASIANGAVLLQVAAVSDPVIAPAGNGLLVHQLVPKLARVVAVGTNLTRVQLTSGSLRRFTPLDLAPVNVGTAIESPSRIYDLVDEPYDLAVNEELDAFGVQSNAGAQRIRVAVTFCDGPFKPIRARGFSVHFVNTITLAANAFTGFQPTFDSGLPSGAFVLVGARILSATGLFFRVIPRGGSPLRPGGRCRRKTPTSCPASGAATWASGCVSRIRRLRKSSASRARPTPRSRVTSTWCRWRRQS